MKKKQFYIFSFRKKQPDMSEDKASLKQIIFFSSKLWTDSVCHSSTQTLQPTGSAKSLLRVENHQQLVISLISSFSMCALLFSPSHSAHHTHTCCSQVFDSEKHGRTIESALGNGVTFIPERPWKMTRFVYVTPDMEEILCFGSKRLQTGAGEFTQADMQGGRSCRGVNPPKRKHSFSAFCTSHTYCRPSFQKRCHTKLQNRITNADTHRISPKSVMAAITILLMSRNGCQLSKRAYCSHLQAGTWPSVWEAGRPQGGRLSCPD
ncbi:hypothetical protein JZ751_008801 [Albula glossodonta]|uniref:Uncharacterized protein n=1 Tax=Albula glossodonta TaxID=121402 RepID=A0A8T2PAD7_9TELE|nr:hypothetical protein JZ751_008801 [Albula glossodonta]